MRKFFGTLAMLLALASSAGAAGTVVQTVTDDGDIRIVTMTWTGDASAGTLPSTAFSSTTMNSVRGWYLTQAITDPGATTPTDDYDIVLNDSSGLDLMSGNLADRDEANTEVAFPDTITRPIDTTLTFVVSNTTKASGLGVTKFYFSKNPAPGVVSVSAAAGGSTEAKQDDANALLTTIDADTSGLFGTVAGSEQQVDVVTLPAGNLGQQNTAASLSIVPASNTPDGTYVGDIKFGEALPAGTAGIGKLTANSGVDIGDVTVDNLVTDIAVDSAQTNDPVYTGGIFETTPTVIESGDAGALHLDANQNLKVVNLTTIDAMGPVLYTLTSGASANLTSVTDGATTLYGITVTSTDATVVYLRLYNKATAPDPSACAANSDCPVFDIAVPSAATGGGAAVPIPSQGIYLSTGLGLAIVTDAAVTGETAVAANEVKVNLIYYHP